MHRFSLTFINLTTIRIINTADCVVVIFPVPVCDSTRMHEKMRHCARLKDEHDVNSLPHNPDLQ